MIDVLRTATQVQAFLDQQGWRCCIIGGLAVGRWGHPRATVDVDVTLLTGLGREEEFIAPLLDQFSPRIPDALERAVLGRVLLLQTKTGTPIDIALGATGIEEAAVERSSVYRPRRGIHFRTCSAEDLVVMKAFADRDLDWGDIRSVLVAQQNKLDWPYIEKQLIPLCELKENGEIVPRLRRLREETRA